MDKQFTLWLFLVFGSWILVFYLILLVLYIDTQNALKEEEDIV